MNVIIIKESEKKKSLLELDLFEGAWRQIQSILCNVWWAASDKTKPLTSLNTTQDLQVFVSSPS